MTAFVYTRRERPAGRSFFVLRSPEAIHFKYGQIYQKMFDKKGDSLFANSPDRGFKNSGAGRGTTYRVDAVEAEDHRGVGGQGLT